MTPNDRKYAKSHEWAKVDGNLVIVGITDHAQAALGDITYLNAHAVGKHVAQGAECGVVESVKAASDIYAPVEGDIAEVNTGLADHPEILNQDPYGKGWILKLKNANTAQLATLLDAAGYDQVAGSES